MEFFVSDLAKLSFGHDDQHEQGGKEVKSKKIVEFYRKMAKEVKKSLKGSKGLND